LLHSSSGLPPSLKREVAVSYETLEIMYQTTRRHISEGRDIDNDLDIYVDTSSLRNQRWVTLARNTHTQARTKFYQQH